MWIVFVFAGWVSSDLVGLNSQANSWRLCWCLERCSIKEVIARSVSAYRTEFRRVRIVRSLHLTAYSGSVCYCHGAVDCFCTSSSSQKLEWLNLWLCRALHFRKIFISPVQYTPRMGLLIKILVISLTDGIDDFVVKIWQ